MQDTSLWAFITHASLVVKVVLLILTAASVFSWTIIWQRFFLFKQTRQMIMEFTQTFHSGENLTTLRNQLPSQHSDLAAILHAGIVEFEKCVKHSTLSQEQLIENCQRAMRLAHQQRLERLEAQIPLLATVGSTAPYVGLFGTVWGIMSAFQSLGGVQQATIAMVAPGIAEALIATAIGLFAAIPAVVAYNRFSNNIGMIHQKYDMFQDELIGIFQRSIPTAGEK